jgi:eukaryotic-like serine/threonine-protein kinase
MPRSTPRDEDETAVVSPSGGSSSEASRVEAGSVGIGLVATSTVPSIGRQLGRYLVIEELGRGGMGVVLRAYDPKLQREVALKIVRADALEASTQARLVREARAMARLNHPNVVAVYDVELGESVMVVMEYVPGTTLRGWLEGETRAYAEIVERFSAAGRGLAAAHAEGLLHRDFKLDNVLVGEDGRVRVTDFGLARVSTSPSRESASVDVSGSRESSEDVRLGEELTVAGEVMGTPRYMAPEQSEGREIDARADQYAFCVALWRGLTGRWPFEGRGRALWEAKRGGALRWPSEVAMPRHIVEALRRGLSAEPAQRWPSMPALLTELGRDPSRRRRRVLAAGVLALVAAGAWGVQRVQRARTLATCSSEGAAIEDVWNEVRADAIAAAFEGIELPYAEDTWSRSRTRLDEYAEAWRSTRRATCEQAEVERTLTPELARASRACLDEHRDDLDALLEQLEVPDANAVQNAATATASLPLVRTCTDENRLRHHAEPPSDPAARDEIRALRSRLSRASAAHATGRYAEALEQAKAVLEGTSALSWTPLVVEAKLAVAAAQERLGRYEDARAGYEDAFFDAGTSARDELALEAASYLVQVVGFRLAQHDEGRHWERMSQMLVDRLGLSDDLTMAGLLNNLAPVYYATGAYEDAKILFERALAIREKTLGPEHPSVAGNLNNLAGVLYATGAYEDARIVFERALAIREEALGPEHPEVATSLNNLALVHHATGAYEDAKALQERALTIEEKTLGPEHPEVATSLNNLGLVRSATGAHEDAKALYERALAIQEKALGPEHPNVADSLNNLANVYSATGAYEDAKALQERALAIKEKTLGLEHPEVATSLNNLADVHQARGAYEEAKALYERALAVREKALGLEHPRVAYALVGLAKVALEQRRAGDAVVLARRALTLREQGNVPSVKLAEARFVLARALAQAGPSRVEAVALAEQARDAYREAGSDALDDVERWLEAHGGR